MWEDDKGRLQAEVESNIAKFQQHAQEKDAEISGLQRELQTLRVELHADVI